MTIIITKLAESKEEQHGKSIEDNPVVLVNGVMMFVAPEQTGALYNFPEGSDEFKYLDGLLGSMFVMPAVGFFLVARDPVRHRTWVQATGIMGYTLFLIMTIYYLVRGTIGWDIVTVPYIIQIVFLIALAVLYPSKQVD